MLSLGVLAMAGCAARSHSEICIEKGHAGLGDGPVVYREYERHADRWLEVELLPAEIAAINDLLMVGDWSSAKLRRRNLKLHPAAFHGACLVGSAGKWWIIDPLWIVCHGTCECQVESTALQGIVRQVHKRACPGPDCRLRVLATDR